MTELLLVLTATVDPSKGTEVLTRSDPVVRLGDYQTTLRHWLQFPDQRVQRILFIENSNYPLDSLKAIAEKENPFHKDVEFVSLDCNWYPPGVNYGYAEMRLIELGLNQSRLRRSATHMIKATGRLRFNGVGRLLDRLPDPFDAMVDTHKWITPLRRLSHPKAWAQFMLFNIDFYQAHLAGSYHEMKADGETHIERLLYSKLTEFSMMHKVLFRFPCNIEPNGFPAHRSKSYDAASQRLIYAVRSVARVVAPHWWL